MKNNKTEVDRFWGEHTVKASYFKSQKGSEIYSKVRLDKYPFYREFMELDKSHVNEVIMDYGCGPGNDLIHLLKSSAKKIIGIDISRKALELAKHQISLYTNNDIPVEFIKTLDDTTTIPLETNSIDYILCSGVLHHVSHPSIILKEFFRILKNNSYINVMVYNRDSIFFHVHAAYKRKGGFIGNNVDKVFGRNTDGIKCPISKAYRPQKFIKLCNSIGFKTEFTGGYLSTMDSAEFFNKYKNNLLNDLNINEEHKKFVNMVKINKRGYPIYNKKLCGIGGSYKLHKD